MTGKFKKLNKPGTFRPVVQILFLVIAPAAFSVGFGGMKAFAAAVHAGELDGLSVAMKAALAFLAFTALFGRFFCGWACAFGSYTDFVYGLASRFLRKKIRLSRERDRQLKWLKYFLLALILLFCVLGMRSLLGKISPWDVYGQLISLRPRLRGYTVGIVFFILITIGAACIERFFCRYLCAFGACFAITARVGMFGLKKPLEECRGCRLCTSRCPMGIELHQDDRVPGAECIRCMRCVDACHKSNAKLTFMGRTMPPMLYFILMVTSLFVMFLVLGLIK